MRRAALLAALLALAGAALAGAASASAAPSSLVELGRHLYGRNCVACHGMNGVGTPRTIGAGRLRTQEQQQAVAPSLVGVGALAADFYLRTGYMPLAHLGLQPRRSRVCATTSSPSCQIDSQVTVSGVSISAATKSPQPL